MKKFENKQTTLADAIARYVHDGCSFTLGGLGIREPVAAAHEIIRQGRKNLNMVMASGMDTANLLLGAGCISKVETAYLWIGVVGTGINFRRAAEKGIPNPIEIEEYTNSASSMRFLAGALNIPYIPTRSMLGSDIPANNPKIKIEKDPYTNQQVALVPASNPDVAIIHVQKADVLGNGQVWGLGVNDQNIARAAKHVILTCEEIVPTSEIRKNPNLTAVPYYCVDAVCHVPYAAHPLWVYGYYWCDIPFRRDFMLANKTQEGLEGWVDEWIMTLPDWEAYLEKVGRRRLEMLMQMERESSHIPTVAVEETGE